MERAKLVKSFLPIILVISGLPAMAMDSDDVVIALKGIRYCSRPARLTHQGTLNIMWRECEYTQKLAQLNATESTIEHHIDHATDLQQYSQETKQNINYRNEIGETALLRSTSYGDAKFTYLLLQARADVCLADKYGNTPLSAAAIHWHRNELFQILAHLTTLSPLQCDAVKNWLLVHKRLSHIGPSLPKEIRKLVAKHLQCSIMEDMRQQIINAGTCKAFESKDEWKWYSHTNAWIVLLKQFLNRDFLTFLVQKQTLLPKLIKAEINGEVLC